MKRNVIQNKGLLNSFVLKILLIIILASCSKKNNTLATESKGASTISNDVSSVGPAGPHNNLVYYGTNDPDPLVGCLGDYYLDVNKGFIYGPKVTSGWNTFLALNGASAAENKVLSGSSLPTPGIGTTGDYYVNTADFLFYGPKASTGWGNPIDLQNQGK